MQSTNRNEWLGFGNHFSCLACWGFVARQQQVLCFEPIKLTNWKLTSFEDIGNKTNQSQAHKLWSIISTCVCLAISIRFKYPKVLWCYSVFDESIQTNHGQLKLFDMLPAKINKQVRHYGCPGVDFRRPSHVIFQLKSIYLQTYVCIVS